MADALHLGRPDTGADFALDRKLDSIPIREGLNKGWRKDEGRGGCSPATVRVIGACWCRFGRSAPRIGRVADTLRPLAAQ